ncbi:MAG: hypothetical protein HMLKMBBP_00496 [Planctomycetes bacterium]|nr:hypothetical protein [Planctomycetota bacterium]
MLTTLSIQNFRGFDRHELDLRPMTVVVGRNNAGKSTIVEALRLVALVTERYRSLAYKEPPSWASLSRKTRGVSPSLRATDLDFGKAFHQYADPPAIIRARFAGGAGVTVHVGPDSAVFAELNDDAGRPIRDRAAAHSTELPSIAIMPQVAPLQDEESVLTEDYVRAATSTRLASLHFRNQIHVYRDRFPDFQVAVERSWPGVRVDELTLDGPLGDQTLHLHVRDGAFTGEAALMGHGLQMWLQAIWFIVRETSARTVILDEPDVYMHPDLQRRILGLVRGRFDQSVIATHSIEIMSDVEPRSILIVDRRRSRSEFADSLPQLQQVMNNLGSVHNVHLARLATATKFVLVEGDDLAVLKRLHRTLFPATLAPLDSLPNDSVGGWDGWQKALGAAQMMRNAVGDRVSCYCIFDSDFHTADEIDARRRQAQAADVTVKVWERKEIENYLLCPRAISAAIERRLGRPGPAPDVVKRELESICESLKQPTIEQHATAAQQRDRRLALATAMDAARGVAAARLTTSDGVIGFVPGKIVLERLSAWTQREFGSGFNAVQVAVEMTTAEIPAEMREFLAALEGKDLS